MNNSVDHSQRAHSALGASSASRWLACPSSVHLSEGLPNKSSKFAAEGTCSHELADLSLNMGQPCANWIGEELEGWVVTQEMADFTQTYVDYVLKVSEGKELSVEERITLDFVDSRMFGTNDAIVYEEFGELEVIDLKYGMGVEVDPVENKQLLYYALGAAQGGEYTSIKMTIVQPRVNNPIKSWTVTPERLEEFKSELLQGVERIDSKIECFELGDHCRFCKAKAICPAQKNNASEITKVMFAEDIAVKEESLPKPSTLTMKEVEKVLNNAKLIKDWISSVEGYAHAALESGEEVTGYKLVAKRSTRKLVNPKEFELAFPNAEIHAPAKLLGIPALEKLIGKKDVAPFIVTPDTGTTIAPAKDKRKAIQPTTAAELFEETKSINFDEMSF